MYHVNVSLTLMGMAPFSHINVCKQQNQMLLLIVHIAFLKSKCLPKPIKQILNNNSVHLSRH
uniref:ATGSL11 (Glucan synthase-like 11) n=1 Tax=Arundo donax TaxID=35708 RepID=A0A0A9E641_ARUDO